MSEDQQFCLRWNNFQAYITSQFETLRDDEDFVDVTLACEGQRLGAHKVVLSACSPFFKELFKTNPCPHPIIFMRDVELRHVIALLEFMYAGEVNVAQAHLSGFLKTAESLQIRGLTDASRGHKENELYQDLSSSVQTSQCTTISNQNAIKLKQLLPESKQPPSRTITYTQDKAKDTPSPESSVYKKNCKTDSDDNRLTDFSDRENGTHKTPDVKLVNSSINPFALTSNKGIHSEIDISSDLIEPKLELPDYSEEDTSHDESHNFMDLNDIPNSFSNLPGGMEIIPGTSGATDISQDSQVASRIAKEGSLQDETSNQSFQRSTSNSKKRFEPLPWGFKTCNFCGKHISSSSNLQKHIFRMHSVQPLLKCALCQSSVKDKYSLRDHLRTKHGVITAKKR